MKLLFAITVCLAFLYAEGRVLIRSVHMLQLSSYQYPGYFQTLSRSKKYYLSALISFFALALIALAFRGNARYVALFFVFLLYSQILHPISSGKIKLTYTLRVKRMLITAYVLLTAYCILAILPGNGIVLWLMLTLMYCASPFFIVVANFINSPLELFINEKFTNEARELLLSAPKMRIVGITGSFGKTSMKFYLQALLNEDYNLLVPPGNFNTTLGVVRTIRESMRGYHNLYLCEMGARHTGDIKEICDLVQPDFGVITSIGNQHLETFKTFANIKKTKLELADSVNDKGGVMFINADSVEDADMLPYDNIVTYGTSGLFDYAVYSISANEHGMTFMIRCKKTGEAVPFQTTLLGMHNAINVVGAVAVANYFGISLKKLSARVQKLNAVEHRLELVPGENEIIIDDAYNSNPNGAKAALQALELFPRTSYYRVLVTPGMVELGKKQADENRSFGEQAAKVCDYVIIVGRTNMDSIKEGLEKGGFDDEHMRRCVYSTTSVNDALRKAKSKTALGKKNVILIENDLPDNY